MKPLPHCGLGAHTPPVPHMRSQIVPGAELKAVPVEVKGCRECGRDPGATAVTSPSSALQAAQALPLARALAQRHEKCWCQPSPRL